MLLALAIDVGIIVAASRTQARSLRDWTVVARGRLLCRRQVHIGVLRGDRERRLGDLLPLLGHDEVEVLVVELLVRGAMQGLNRLNVLNRLTFATAASLGRIRSVCVPGHHEVLFRQPDRSVVMIVTDGASRHAHLTGGVGRHIDLVRPASR